MDRIGDHRGHRIRGPTTCRSGTGIRDRRLYRQSAHKGSTSAVRQKHLESRVLGLCTGCIVSALQLLKAAHLAQLLGGVAQDRVLLPCLTAICHLRQLWDSQRQCSPPAVATVRLAYQQSGHLNHLCQKHQVALIEKRAVVTWGAGQFSMEPGVGNHWALVWCDNPNVS